MPRRTNKNPRVFRAVGNVAGRGVKGLSNVLGSLKRGTGKVFYIGTGAANKVIGATGRLGKNLVKRTRKITGLKRR